MPKLLGSFAAINPPIDSESEKFPVSCCLFIQNLPFHLIIVKKQRERERERSGD